MKAAHRWVTVHEMVFIDTKIPEGTIVDGVHERDIPQDIRWSWKRQNKRCPRDQRPVAIFWEGKVRWAFSPEDVRIHLANQGGLLRRRVYNSKRAK